MKCIEQIFVFIHQDYNRLGFLGDQEGLWYLDPESYQHYLDMKLHQKEIIRQVICDEESALFVYPSSLSDLDSYPNYKKGDRNIIEDQLLAIAEWANALGDRFVLLKDEQFEVRQITKGRLFWKKEIPEIVVKDPEFIRKLPFIFSSRTIKVRAFGEYTSDCVSDYGKAICRALTIPEDQFHILAEASIENIQLMHEREEEFYNNLPGWRK